MLDGAKSLNEVAAAAEPPFSLVFGNEVFGVDQTVVDACQGALEIPQEGTKHSLNIAVCVGAVLWDVFAKMRRISPQIS